MSGQQSAPRTDDKAQGTAVRRWYSLLLVPLTLLALSLVAIYPLFQGSLPCSDDAAFHLLRLTQLDRLLREGVLYSRWAPDMAQGYGLPFFNFYAPLSYYLAEFASLLAQNLNLGMRLALALGFYLTGVTTYLLARDHFSRRAALVAAVAAMYAPYLAFDVYFRGNLAESLAWPLMPLALWAMGRLARTSQARWLALTAVSYAAILLTHNVFSLIFSPLLALYGIWEVFNRQSPIVGRRSSVVNCFAALLLGLGLSAFFWLPAIVERTLVHSDRLLVPPIFVYWGNFLTLGEIFTPPQTVHPDLINPSPARALGLVPLLLALPGLLLGWRRLQPGPRRQLVFFGLATAAYVFLMTSVSDPVWANLPLIEYVQFPWRLLGPAALTLSMLTGASVDALSGPRLTVPLLPLFFGSALVLSNLAWLDARFCPGLANPTVADIQTFERDSATIGTTAKGEYLPRTVEYMPDQPAAAPFAPLPETATLQFTNQQPLHLEATIRTSAPLTMTANIFYYPGWCARVDGHAVPVTSAAGTGLITFSIPAGDHALSLRFGSTPLRTAANTLSAVSLLLLLFVAFDYPSTITFHRSSVRHHSAFTVHDSLSFFLLGLALFLLVHFLLPRLETPLRRAGLPGMGETAVFRDALVLRDYQIASRTLAADDALTITATWQAGQPVDRAYRDTVRLIGPDGHLWSEKTADVPRVFRAAPLTQLWLPHQYAESQHLLEPLPGTPPGTYHVELILFDRETLAAVPLRNGPLTLDLGTVQITPPRKAVAPRMQHDADFRWGALQLTGYSLDRAEAAPGDPFLLTLAWRADATPTLDYSAHLTLIAPDGRLALQWDLPPVRADFPTDQWTAGNWWRAQHGFRLPAGLESGAYGWQLALCAGACTDHESTVYLGALTITAPDRTFTPPPLEIPLSAPFGHLATLLGVNLSPAPALPGPLTLTLAWRAEAEMTTSYRVFVHLIDEAGQTLAQSDGEPSAWSRPTTGWLPGEIVLDSHKLDLTNVPSGTYQINVGLYDPADGERIPLPDGATAVTIPSITIP
jgi:hypothetical protein